MSAAASDTHLTGKHEFKAEIQQLLEILIHSVYQSKDVFLRELISNAADALEKVRFAQVRGAAIHTPEAPLEVRIETKKVGDQSILVITDTGIGMTAEEVHDNIGTIAHSGATAFLKKLAESGETAENEKAGVSLIGRFGVGFYSVFMVAEKVVLSTRSMQPDGKAVAWTSDGLGSYTIEILEDERPRGTSIEIHLKADEARFAEGFQIRSAIQRYSNFVPFPILLDGERINQATALWREPASQIKDEQYNEFFKLVCHDTQDPLLRVHQSVDAPIQYSALLFVPQNNPESFGFGRSEVSLHLYVKRVMIDAENKNLLPDYLRFVKGVVESDDVPLNISRETLQENRVVSRIRDGLTRSVLDKLKNLADTDAEKYLKFWETFSGTMKEGYQDYQNRERVQELLRFHSSREASDKKWVSLAEYVAAMPAGQTAIYYLSGASIEALARDPRLELFRKRKIEVLYLTDVADEFVLASLGNYKEHKLVSADQVKPDEVKEIRPADAPESDDKPAADVERLIARFKEILGEKVTDVRISERLVDSPACLVGDEDQPTGHMDRVFRRLNKSSDLPQRVLEINPRHPLVADLVKIVDKSSSDPFLERACLQLFEGAMLIDGYLTDPHQLVERMNQVLADAASAKAT